MSITNPTPSETRPKRRGRPPKAKAAPKRYKVAKYRKVDPDTGYVFSPGCPVVVETVRDGSWLASQNAAGVIIEV